MTTKTTTTTTKVLIQSSLEGKPYKPFGLSAIALEKYKKQEEGETLEESIAHYGNDCVQSYPPLIKLVSKLGLGISAQDGCSLRIVSLPPCLEGKWTIAYGLKRMPGMMKVHDAYQLNMLHAPLHKNWVIDDYYKGPEGIVLKTRENEFYGEVLLNVSYGGISLSEEAKQLYHSSHTEKTKVYDDLDKHIQEERLLDLRSDAALIAIVKELGPIKSAKPGATTSLGIERIPANTPWFIYKKQMGGMESVVLIQKNWAFKKAPKTA